MKQPLMITQAHIERYDVSGPRYTSYPTADRFVEAFDASAYVKALEQRNISAWTQPLSVYVHVPFCESLCFYCACNKIVTKRHEQGAQYLNYLKREIDLHLSRFDHPQTVNQCHLGGGTPTFLNDDELSALMQMLKQVFVFEAAGEYSIEIDPRTVDTQRLQHLRDLGFNRLSFGVQDFDADVQQAVHRVQSYKQVASLMQDARNMGFQSMNADLIYGLPKQTPVTFRQTISQIITLRPDRIALYGYAHLPSRFKPQRRILHEDLPNAVDKIQMLSEAIQQLISAGYVYIGMDHFALPEDALAIAKQQGRLHRNFQGYSTMADQDILALGVSAIGKMGSTYSQNAKTIEEYYDYLDQGQLPIVRGLALNRDDLIRRAVIMAIMCHGELSYESIELSYMINFKEYFKTELQQIEEKQKQGLVYLEHDGIKVTDMGWFFVRAIAMVFDRYLQLDANRARFSKIL
ncbi:oxygen-independent coproporphyrinogen III oxidase [Methylophilus aquaticus]|uniref:Coproporphyrinogen-III oxidase n=1 Tax=Methylophilus aquaticus TaxID=1971610 RepID=A0ABT9JX85_9PROT|nr:oxygen-independent coproporphyrinogen III oxidase [Methylophilus aquaticus]MDP8568691.1 oxygen-independent coproporphyrinogen III oxidase [Methylophilus aquaticus]